MGNIDKNRRKWLSLGGIVLGASMMPSTVLAIKHDAEYGVGYGLYP